MLLKPEIWYKFDIKIYLNIKKVKRYYLLIFRVTLPE